MAVFCSNGKYKADCVEGKLQKKKVWEGTRHVAQKMLWQTLNFHQELSLGLFVTIVWIDLTALDPQFTPAWEQNLCFISENKWESCGQKISLKHWCLIKLRHTGFIWVYWDLSNFLIFPTLWLISISSHKHFPLNFNICFYYSCLIDSFLGRVAHFSLLKQPSTATF